ncbi:FTR1 family iron permease [Alkalinema pantanalense CENA528]|uniref:FTR1 family iron permease n=1 Tax=Alkalinema pantanalense TaxID=1620705 RepID=UPI003D6F1E43
MFEPLLEGVFSLMAIGLLSWMLIWMTQNARTLKTDVEGAIHAALNQAKAAWGVFAFIFFAVIREGFEMVLFISAKFQQGLVPALGTLAGLAGAVAIGVMLFKLGVRLNLRKFFIVMGVLLLMIIVGLVVTALGHFDVALNALASLDRKSAALCFFQERFVKAENRACILGPMVWNFSKVLPDDQFPGLILSALFGYTQRLFMVQGVAYGVFLIAVGGIYFQSLTGKLSLPWKKMERLSNKI